MQSDGNVIINVKCAKWIIVKIYALCYLPRLHSGPYPTQKNAIPEPQMAESELCHPKHDIIVASFYTKTLRSPVSTISEQQKHLQTMVVGKLAVGKQWMPSWMHFTDTSFETLTPLSFVHHSGHSLPALRSKRRCHFRPYTIPKVFNRHFLRNANPSFAPVPFRTYFTGTSFKTQMPLPLLHQPECIQPALPSKCRPFFRPYTIPKAFNRHFLRSSII